jgi:hypothetical protein
LIVLPFSVFSHFFIFFSCISQGEMTFLLFFLHTSSRLDAQHMVFSPITRLACDLALSHRRPALTTPALAAPRLLEFGGGLAALSLDAPAMAEGGGGLRLGRPAGSQRT